MKILSKNDVKEAADILNKGGVIAFPTETVFGLGVLATNEENYNHLVKVKNRRPDKPFTLMISNVDQVKKYLDVNELSLKIIKNCMPGPITLVMKAKKPSPYYVDHGTGFVGIRMPDDKFVLSLIDAVNEPLFVPSCNKADQPPCKNTAEVKAVFEKEIDAVIDGNCTGGVPSTVVKVDGNDMIILRQGNLTLEEIKEKIK